MVIKSIDEAKALARLLSSTYCYIAIDKNRDVHAFEQEPFVLLNSDFTETRWIGRDMSPWPVSTTIVDLHKIYLGKFQGNIGQQWSNRCWKIREENVT